MIRNTTLGVSLPKGGLGIPSEDVLVRVDVLGCTSERPFGPADAGATMASIIAESNQETKVQIPEIATRPCGRI